MKQLETIIGLEVHAQMNTKSKMFCACDNDAFGKPPNTTVCPICMGHPGTLPVPNEEAIKKAVKAALTLKCSVEADNHLDRKNYFYPDLPMGFQISQYDYPLAKGGYIDFVPRASSMGARACHPERSDSGDEGHARAPSAQHDTYRCHLVRLHIENDAGKLVHVGGRSYCDFNRAGTPLMEIVTEPDLRSPSDAVAFAKELQRILMSVNASEADMYKGMMRFDASISLRPKGENTLYPRSEIKNLNSFKSLEKALTFEEKRLRELWEQGKPQDKEVTVHWDDDKEMGVILRDKESAADYRYFPEPDIPPLHFDEKVLKEVQESLGELPSERKEKYLSAGLDEDQATMLVGLPKLAMFFDEVANVVGVKRAGSIILTQLLGFLKAAEKELHEGPRAEGVVELLQCVDDRAISANAGKGVLEKMVQTGKGSKEIIREEGMQQVSDEAELEKLVTEALQRNPKAFADLKGGKQKAAGAIIGYVMQKTNGQANPKLVSDILAKLV